MRSFNVYERHDGKFKAVKNGWSWPAFLFGPIWALFVQLWLIGLLLLPVEVFLQILSAISDEILREEPGAYTERTTLVGQVIAILILSIHISFGSFGNAWKRKKLESAAYKLNKTLDAKSKENAITLSKDVIT